MLIKKMLQTPMSQQRLTGQFSAYSTFLSTPDSECTNIIIIVYKRGTGISKIMGVDITGIDIIR